MSTFDVYFVAFFKNGEPQHLVAGPFIREIEARAIANRSLNYVVVKTTMPFEVVA